MKFSDGCWMMLPGVSAASPAQAYELTSDSHTATIVAPASVIHNRGATLSGPTFTIKLSSPIDDVIRVKMTHFADNADLLPRFDINESSIGDVSIHKDDHLVRLTSGSLAVEIPADQPWSLNYIAEGKVLTKSGRKAMGTATTPAGGFTYAQLDLTVGELVYGLGERFTSFVKNGQVVDMWNRDGGTNSDQAYKNIPFYLTNKGYGVFVNHPEEVSFEIATEKTDAVQFSVPGESIDYFVIYGPTPKDILRKYTALTGRPALPPSWSFGLWLSTSFTTEYDEQTVTSFIKGMEDRSLPLSVFHFDCFWMREFHWCDFEWDSRIFPDPSGMLSRLKSRGLKICVWINPYISAHSSLFEEGSRLGYFLRKPDGLVWQTDQWQPGMAIVDFTNPEASAWYRSKLKNLLDMGVDAFKTDFGERIPTDVVYHNGADTSKMHNYYAFMYNQTVFDLLLQERGAGEAIVFARSASAGSQSLPVHWGGDCDSTFEAMAASLRGGLSFGLSGFGFWSHDIGGFEGTPPVELYKRWVAFGLLSSHSRLHGSTSYRVPWIYDEEACDVLRFFTRLKCSLMPYLFSTAVEARDNGTPMMRAMLLEFPEDRACDYLDRQYMFGESLLVAPVFAKDSSVSYYVPEGIWTNYFSNEEISGPSWRNESHGYQSLPLLVRPNTLLATADTADQPDYNYHSNLTLRVYQLADGKSASVSIYDNVGAEKVVATASRNGYVVRITLSKRLDNWSVLFVGHSSLQKIEGGDQESGPDGVCVRVSSADLVEVSL